MKLDGQLHEVSYYQPFFKEYSLSVTGHPSAFTYGWVWNDDKYLYVAMDFTGDNTMDGNKDFAKVYINTEKGVKEFKVSVPETKWGNPGFTYTSKVNYQHKVYEFKIPLHELTKGASGEQDMLLLAFSAYGTDGTDGVVMGSYYLRGDDARKHPLANLWTKYGRGKLEDMIEVYTIGMAWAMTLEAALKIALKEVGYKKLDGEVIYQTCQKLTGVQRADSKDPTPIAQLHGEEVWRSNSIRFEQER